MDGFFSGRTGSAINCSKWPTAAMKTALQRLWPSFYCGHRPTASASLPPSQLPQTEYRDESDTAFTSALTKSISYLAVLQAIELICQIMLTSIW